MNWGNKIVLAFVGFVALIFVLVYVSVNTEFNLVEENYYEQELAYESQIQRIKNHNALVDKPVFKINRKSFEATISFPVTLVESIREGRLNFYRSNTARLDKEFTIKFNDNGEFIVDISQFPVGAWKVKIQWNDGEKEYYKEIDFVI